MTSYSTKRLRADISEQTMPNLSFAKLEHGLSRIQILTIAELLKGARVQMPMQNGTFKQAQKVKHSEGEQVKLFQE
jgi:hypothetical protein